MTDLQLAYRASIAILPPIAFPTLLRIFGIYQGCFSESAGDCGLVEAL